jgi:hypothetical protein
MCVWEHCEYMYSIYIYIHGIYNNLIPSWLSTHQSTIIAYVPYIAGHHLVEVTASTLPSLGRLCLTIH